MNGGRHRRCQFLLFFNRTHETMDEETFSQKKICIVLGPCNIANTFERFAFVCKNFRLTSVYFKSCVFTVLTEQRLLDVRVVYACIRPDDHCPVLINDKLHVITLQYKPRRKDDCLVSSKMRIAHCEKYTTLRK